MDAATVEIVVPRRVDFLGTLVMTVVFFGPCHVIVAFLIEWVMQRLMGSWRSFGPPESATRWLPQLSLIEWLIGYYIIAATIGFPFAYRHRAKVSDRSHGQQRADNDWAQRQADCFADDGADSEVRRTIA